MSGVDVMAVMYDMGGVLNPSRSPEEAAWYERIVRARGAAAELIQVAESLSEDASICGMNTARIDAALRRVKGEG